MRVIAGLVDQNDLSGTQTSGLAEVVVHPFWDGRFDNDIALLHLSTPLSFNGRVNAISPMHQYSSTSFNDPSASGTPVTTMGWGKTQTAQLSQTLQQIAGTVTDWTACANFYAQAGVTLSRDRHVCMSSGSSGNDGACNGDLGGPMVKINPNYSHYFDELVGLMELTLSNSSGACVGPRAYTRLNDYIPWINLILTGCLGATPNVYVYPTVSSDPNYNKVVNVPGSGTPHGSKYTGVLESRSVGSVMVGTSGNDLMLGSASKMCGLAGNDDLWSGICDGGPGTDRCDRSSSYNCELWH
jgi:secreted trypsin-like serine protease